jgi:hypothetical protein
MWQPLEVQLEDKRILIFDPPDLAQAKEKNAAKKNLPE